MGDNNLYAINVHRHPSILRKLSAEFGNAATVLLAIASTSVAITIVIGPCVPSCLCKAVAIILDNVHFHTGWLLLTLDIAVICRLEEAWVGRHKVKVVVHPCMCSRSVHVKLDVTTEQVESLLAMDTSTTRQGPPSLAIPLSLVPFDCKVILCWTKQFTRSEVGHCKQGHDLHLGRQKEPKSESK